MSFNSFDGKIQDFVINYSAALFPDKKINFVSNNRTSQQNSIKDIGNVSGEEKNQKNWWEFWK